MTSKGLLERTSHSELTSCESWPLAEARLREGGSGRAVAKYMHSMGDMTHLKMESLARRLQKYKASVLQPKQALSSTYIDTMIEKFAEPLNDVDEMTKLIMVQKQRVSKDLKMEENMPKLAPWLLKEIQFLFDMVERRAKMLQTMGVLHRAPEKHMVAVAGDDTWKQLLDVLDPDSRSRARAIIQGEYAAGREQEALQEQERRGAVLAGNAEVSNAAEETETD